jgi:hypothetical protein
MSEASVTCGKCLRPLPALILNSTAPARCPSCNVSLHALVFPALFRPVARGEAGERVVSEGEASCYYHTQKKAVVPCNRCGRFLCALCDFELNGEHICPSCLESGKQKGKMERLEHDRILYDDIALALAVWPMILMCTLSFITAPAALFIAIRHWNAPNSVVRRGKARYILAIVLAALQLTALVCWLVFFVAMRAHAKSGFPHAR